MCQQRLYTLLLLVGCSVVTAGRETATTIRARNVKDLVEAFAIDASQQIVIDLIPNQR